MSAPRYAWLPQVYREIAAATSLETALTLARARGGERVYIPARVEAGHWLAELVGLDAARVICDLYTAADLTLPASPDSPLKTAARQADAAIAQGASANEAARRSGLTSRAIFKRKARARERQQRPDLFNR